MTVVYSLAVTIALFAAGTWFESIRSDRPAWDVWIRRLGNTSFGIYLVHPIFVHGWLNLLHDLGIHINPWLNTPITAVLSVAASFLVISALQRTPWLAWLVGEPRTVVKPIAKSVASDHALVG
jgi:peptidoglycan/LPS O-acetylase OafA/YrhL